MRWEGELYGMETMVFSESCGRGGAKGMDGGEVYLVILIFWVGGI